jgi:hypothetical protein
MFWKRYALLAMALVLMVAVSYAELPDPTLLLNECLIEFLNGGNPEDGHTFTVGTSIAPPPFENPRSLASIQVRWSQLVELQGEKVHMYRGIDTRDGSSKWIWQYTDSSTTPVTDYSRPMTWADFHSLRWQLSLSPYWVICHVLNDYYRDDFTIRYSIEADPENPSYYLISRKEQVLLTAEGDADGLQGLFLERLVINPETYEIVNYTVTSEDGDGVFFQDMRNLYEYVRDEGTGNILYVNVTQGSTVVKGKAYFYQVTPVAQ